MLEYIEKVIKASLAEVSESAQLNVKAAQTRENCI